MPPTSTTGLSASTVLRMASAGACAPDGRVNDCETKNTIQCLHCNVQSCDPKPHAESGENLVMTILHHRQLSCCN